VDKELAIDNCLYVFDAITTFGLYPDIEKIVFSYIQSHYDELLKDFEHPAKLAMLQILVKDMSLSLIREAAENHLLDLSLVKDVINSLKTKIRK